MTNWNTLFDTGFEAGNVEGCTSGSTLAVDDTIARSGTHSLKAGGDTILTDTQIIIVYSPWFDICDNRLLDFDSWARTNGARLDSQLMTDVGILQNRSTSPGQFNWGRLHHEGAVAQAGATQARVMWQAVGPWPSGYTAYGCGGTTWDGNNLQLPAGTWNIGYDYTYFGLDVYPGGAPATFQQYSGNMRWSQGGAFSIWAGSSFALSTGGGFLATTTTRSYSTGPTAFGATTDWRFNVATGNGEANEGVGNCSPASIGVHVWVNNSAGVRVLDVFCMAEWANNTVCADINTGTNALDNNDLYKTGNMTGSWNLQDLIIPWVNGTCFGWVESGAPTKAALWIDDVLFKGEDCAPAQDDRDQELANSYNGWGWGGRWLVIK